MHAAKPLFDYPKYWAECFGPAPFLPMSREEMDQLGWDSCDVIIVTGDAYVDHPSFGMAIIGRLLEAQGFRVGIISQPDWQSKDDFMKLGQPNLFFGIAAGNMDSMINRYTADRKVRSDDAYTPGGQAGKRPDRASLVYSQRCKEAYTDTPVVLGGIEASLRRIAHYDYWQDKVRRSILMDATADILLYGNAERAIVEVAQRLARGEAVEQITDVRGTAFIRRDAPEGWFEIDSTRIDRPGKVDKIINPYVNTQDLQACAIEQDKGPVEDPNEAKVVQLLPNPKIERDRTVIRLPSFEKVRNDPALYAHANRVLHLETNPGNARALVQRHGDHDIWLNAPPIPLTTEEMDYVFASPYARVPHPSYGGEKIPAYDMIRFSVNIMRGCFGGCTFCSITEHEGRIIQNRSHESILHEIEEMKKLPGFTGVVSDLGGPTANMYRIACKSPEIEQHCRKPSCVYPGICENLNTDHSSLIELYRKARALPGVKKILIASGLRYDLAVESPEYVKELVTHHVGGYLKIAPEHTERGPLDKMMKPGIGSYDKFKRMFDKYSKEAGKEQYLIPYFIAAHPGTTDEDMMNLALWLKANGFRADQVQAFYPSPMASATAMYHSGKNPLRKVTYKSEGVPIVKSEEQRRLHKAFLRYHDPKGWPMLREALQRMGRADLIGNGKNQLIPTHQPATEGYQSARRKNSTPVGSKKAGQGGKILTQHNGLPPRSHDGNAWDKREEAKAAAEARRKAAAGGGKPGGKSRKPSQRPAVPR
ncbi:MAG: YgiQ family radical SAM protein [Gammaproteobacteria bacterium]|uniref:YgiQ family radical SAM protein n=1 Tax=Stutzerimonas xanthomarina TaxID=271420 RepID=UPI000C6334D3|nr:YgiQ family radical SAM protein [Stutzerimonas xanthomarina]MBK57616.1 YgiQ family radical SAM protein [Pseudomonas sp.]MBU0811009.1 YgiQ family radical SAM protein [Gammaproteobacteria bacterium]MBK3845324.1 YgiQ family radical SAM protein [Stutzerimonas xanthomarina]MBK3846239.1 YgiQ family radical SAM protein [Stutzerimonas xanthomarina]MBU1300217.1 YgiQ family radical SAM protein [Gammaproteobacteria bacterium]|tara:strand:+ start:1481 stop:3766 length:2286 start_codon:yes stop_codon:yes gene_type:complete